MSLATRCPACGTTFRIEPDQLALADGWARCGRCSTVFDAAAERREHVDDAAAPVVSAPDDVDAFGAALLSFRNDALSLPVPPVPQSGSDAASATPGDDADADEAARTPDDAPVDSQQALSPPVPSMPPAFDPWRELPSLSLESNAPVPVTDRPSVTTVADTDTDADAAEVAGASPPSSESQGLPAASEARATAGPLWPVPPSGSTGPETGASGVRPAARAESVAPAGVIQAASEPVAGEGAGARKPRGAGRRRSWRAVVLAVAIALLLAALLMQVLYRQRDAVAARLPALRPALAALCGFTGCTIAGLRRPGDIAIEGATFTHVQDSDRYRLAFALRNQAGVPLAMPAVELSLLDAQERAIVRRVLMPADFGAAVEAVLPPLAERAGAVSFALDGGDAGAEPLPRVAGYAMVAFYP